MTVDVRRTLLAAAERILPADDWPGAAEAGVVEFMERLVDQPFFDSRPLFSRGLELLDSLAGAMFGSLFFECPPAEQDAVLHRLQSIPHPTAQRFFRLLVRMTLAGYFCDPVYGGNRGGVVWRRLRFQPDPAG